MDKEDKISLTFLVIFVLGILNLIISLSVRFFNLLIRTSQVRILLLLAFLFLLAFIFSSKKSIIKNNYFKFFKKQIKFFLETFKEWKIIVNGIFIEILSILSIILILFLTIRFIRWNFRFIEHVPGLLNVAQSYLQTGAPAVDDAMIQSLQKNSDNFKNAMIFSGIGIVLSYLLMIFSTGFFQGHMFSKFKKQKFDKIFKKKFIILNYVLVLSFTLIMFLIFKFIKSASAANILLFFIFLFLYLGLIMYSVFDKSKNIANNIGSLFKMTFIKIYLLFVPIILAYILFLFLFFILGFVNLNFSQITFGIVYASIIIIYITWLKFFTVKIVGNIQNE